VTAFATLVRFSASSPDPSPGRARDLLRRELLHPAYHHQNLMQRFVGWLGDRLHSALSSASQASSLGTLGASIVLLVVLLLLGLLVSRLRRTSRRAEGPGAVLTAERLTAAQLRARAEAALAAGEPRRAVVEGFRALTLRQVERGRLPDLPGATAREVAATLRTTYAEQGPRVDGAAELFDLVHYGDRPATADQAGSVLRLDDDLAARR
jgi:hypothetical protein